LCSCELTKEIDYATIYGGDRVMIHGFISPQDGVHVIVKKSVAPNKVDADDRIGPATVSLYADDVPIAELTRQDDRLFVSAPTFVPQPDKKYFIKVQTDAFGEVWSAPQPVFPPVAIDSVKLIAEEAPYYHTHLVVYYNTRHSQGNSYYLKVNVYPESVDSGDSDIIIPDEGGTPATSDAYVEFFNPFTMVEQTKDGVNAIERRIYNHRFDSLHIALYTLSSDLSTFLKSMHQYDTSKEDPFFEQVYPVFSNIRQGYGIFASYSVAVKTYQ
jgi:hypothetical protein